MRSIAALILLVAATHGASAHPALPCAISIVRAPAEVAQVIEDLVRAEPRCASTLELRVIPTDDGLYLIGRHPDGRLRERVVPDARSAAEIVVSWLSEPTPPAPTPPAPLPPPFEASSAPTTASVAAGHDSIAVTASVPVRAPEQKWISIAGMVHAGDEVGQGVRAELDLVARDRWTFGAAVSASEAGDSMDPAASSYTWFRDVRLTAYAARTSTFGRWQLRLAGGVGVAHTEAERWDPTPWDSTSDEALTNGIGRASGMTTLAEGSVLLIRRVGDSLGLTAGSVVTWLPQRFIAGGMELASRDVELMFVGGLRVAL